MNRVFPAEFDPHNVSGHYLLDGHTPVECRDLLEWGRKFQDMDRVVAKTDIGPIHISTVFLGIDHGWHGGPPVLFETMIFGSETLDYQTRYCTWEEAERGHQEAVRIVKERN